MVWTKLFRRIWASKSPTECSAVIGSLVVTWWRELLSDWLVLWQTARSKRLPAVDSKLNGSSMRLYSFVPSGTSTIYSSIFEPFFLSWATPLIHLFPCRRYQKYSIILKLCRFAPLPKPVNDHLPPFLFQSLIFYPFICKIIQKSHIMPNNNVMPKLW